MSPYKDAAGALRGLRRIVERLEREYQHALTDSVRLRDRRLELEEELSAVSRSMDFWAEDAAAEAKGDAIDAAELRLEER